VEKVLHNFGKPTDGYNPQAGLIDVGGRLYGTTQWGGSGHCQSGSGYSGCGIVYSINTSGKEKVLYGFAGGRDGTHPVAGLIDVNGTLYGTTRNAGANGLGTVYSVSVSDAEKVLYSFTGRKGDGANPVAGLINVKGTLYGTTFEGGMHGSYGGDGTIFALSP
jgi:uncharacterized repeat protein (TIGR03803 family)